ncbi:hypothetical protein [uncultured Helicobacter sp.]|uniref:hypothetical protein n=2 Tax=uncultured Helicobacter sp. TaxID=175537 RepID=UPI002605DD91|nr:hypothetical protein [uncultured Helicobacter sp.]
MTNYTITSLRGAAIHLHNVPICYRKSIESSAIFIFTWWITSGFALVMTTSIPSLRGRQDEAICYVHCISCLTLCSPLPLRRFHTSCSPPLAGGARGGVFMILGFPTPFIPLRTGGGK